MIWGMADKQVPEFQPDGGRRPRLGILFSGRGSNCQAIATAVANGQLQAEIGLLVSNREQAEGVAWARQRQLPLRVIPSARREREDYDREVVAVLRAQGVEWVCLAGFMRLLSAYFISAYRNRILNIHPSLLPAFPGLEAQRQALEYGVRYTGCTVHLVDETLDGGPIIAQAVTPVRDEDDEAALAARILGQEHRLYVEALQLMLSGNYRLQGRRLLRSSSPASLIAGAAPSLKC